MLSRGFLSSTTRSATFPTSSEPKSFFIPSPSAPTIVGAEGLGMKKDFGSLEVGKVADLVVLDKNPLDNIRNTSAIRYVMQGGQIYDGNTLATVWPKEQPLRPFKIRD